MAQPAQEDHDTPDASASISTASPSAINIYSVFDKRQKALLVALVSTAATFSGFASNIYFPVIPTLARDFNVSTEEINLTVTTYLIFQGLAPSLWGPVSDVKGRRVAYVFTFTVFLAACIGLALAKDYAALVVLRCLQSTGSASTIAIGSGVLGDITTRDERGGYMGVFQAGLLVPVAIGPVIGGALAGSLGWRSIFWFLSIYSGVFLIILILLLPETLRSLVGNGSALSPRYMVRFPLHWYQKTSTIDWHPDTGGVKVSEKKRVDLTGPIRILFSKQAAPLIVFLGIYYAVWQMSITAMSSLFEEEYGLTETQVGLTFFANGFGSMIGTLTTGRLLDLDYRRLSRAVAAQRSSTEHDQGTLGPGEEQFPLEKARLRLVPVFSLAQCLSICVFGWSINFPGKVHIAVPIISTFFTGWAAISTQSIIMTYLVDIFPTKSAAASASLNLCRCLLAAAGTGAVMPMINAVGVGWTFTICVILQLIAFVGPALQWHFGQRWREASLDNSNK
ncbi:major facilitator superfamily protein [Sarocladium implicatum]|nr:major facilitator superfamily protein [Sarocladium implicatum]